MKLVIRVLSQKGNELRRKEYNLTHPRCLIGRAHCDIVLEDDRCSSQHAFLFETAEGLFIKDLRSKNGTSVNGSRTEQIALQAGDVIGIGRTVVKIMEYVPTDLSEIADRGTGAEAETQDDASRGIPM